MSLFDFFWGLWPLLLAFTIWLTIHLGLDRLFPQLDFISNLFWTQAHIHSDLESTQNPPKCEDLGEDSQQKSSQNLQQTTQVKPTGFFVQELKPKSLRSSYERSQEILEKQRNRMLEKWPRLAMRGNLDCLENKNGRSRRSGSEPACSILPQIQALRARRALGSWRYRNMDSEGESHYFPAEELPEASSPADGQNLESGAAIQGQDQDRASSAVDSGHASLHESFSWPRSDEEQEENPEISQMPSGSGLKLDPKSDFDSICLRPADQCDYTCLHGPNCSELEIEPETSQDSQDAAEELLVEGIKALEEFYVDAPIERRRRPSIEEAIMEVKRCSRDLTDYIDQAVNQTQQSAKAKWQKSEEGKGRNLLNKKEAPPSTIKESSESSQTIDEQDGGSAATVDKAQKQEIVRVTQQLLDAISCKDFDAYARLCDPSMTCFEPETLGNLIEGMDFHKFYFDHASAQLPGSSSNAVGGAIRKHHQIHTTLLNPNVHLMGDEGACIAYVRLTQYCDRFGEARTRQAQETRVWQKRNGRGWVCVHVHRSGDPSNFSSAAAAAAAASAAALGGFDH